MTTVDNDYLPSLLEVFAGVFYGLEAVAVYIGLTYISMLLQPTGLFVNLIEAMKWIVIYVTTGSSIISVLIGLAIRRASPEKLRVASIISLFVTIISLPVGGGFMIGAGLSALATSIILNRSYELAIEKSE
ncbi:hypothetical protein ACSU1N_06270 [Thermogladius sp. 4427co]|uniref:hypothetical protein n=1 Tax=Thermogladius sp. 4427co TaxID=3450718 RepID=UPI003F7972CA